MTNIEIISMQCVVNNITEEVNTYAMWQAKGYKVKRGEKACFSTHIWKSVVDKKDDNKKRLIFVKSSFFKKSQVQKVD